MDFAKDDLCSPPSSFSRQGSPIPPRHLPDQCHTSAHVKTAITFLSLLHLTACLCLVSRSGFQVSLHLTDVHIPGRNPCRRPGKLLNSSGILFSTWTRECLMVLDGLKTAIIPRDAQTFFNCSLSRQTKGRQSTFGSSEMDFRG